MVSLGTGPQPDGQDWHEQLGTAQGRITAIIARTGLSDINDLQVGRAIGNELLRLACDKQLEAVYSLTSAWQTMLQGTDVRAAAWYQAQRVMLRAYCIADAPSEQIERLATDNTCYSDEANAQGLPSLINCEMELLTRGLENAYRMLFAEQRTGQVEGGPGDYLRACTMARYGQVALALTYLERIRSDLLSAIGGSQLVADAMYLKAELLLSQGRGSYDAQQTWLAARNTESADQHELPELAHRMMLKTLEFLRCCNPTDAEVKTDAYITKISADESVGPRAHAEVLMQRLKNRTSFSLKENKAIASILTAANEAIASLIKLKSDTPDPRLSLWCTVRIAEAQMHRIPALLALDTKNQAWAAFEGQVGVVEALPAGTPIRSQQELLSLLLGGARTLIPESASNHDELPDCITRLRAMVRSMLDSIDPLKLSFKGQAALFEAVCETNSTSRLTAARRARDMFAKEIQIEPQDNVARIGYYEAALICIDEIASNLGASGAKTPIAQHHVVAELLNVASQVCDNRCPDLLKPNEAADEAQRIAGYLNDKKLTGAINALKAAISDGSFNPPGKLPDTRSLVRLHIVLNVASTPGLQGLS